MSWLSARAMKTIPMNISCQRIFGSEFRVLLDMIRMRSLAVCILLALPALASSEQPEQIKGEASMLGLFKKRISIDEQLLALRTAGIVLNAGVTQQDLFAFNSKDELEKEPYKGLIEVLAIDIEREPFTPVTNKLWMCDYERIEDNGAYKDVIERLELMTGKALGLADIKDSVDIERKQAWVEFTLQGKTIRWDAKVDDDWLDPYIIVKYDSLLRDSGKGVRIYSNHSDFGQSALLAAFTDEEFKVFEKLSKVRLELIEKPS